MSTKAAITNIHFVDGSKVGVLGTAEEIAEAIRLAPAELPIKFDSAKGGLQFINWANVTYFTTLTGGTVSL